MIDETLKSELLSMVRRDLAVRDHLARSGGLFEGYSVEMERVHLEHAGQLEAILDHVGWPTADLVGEEGADAAWRVAQHAISAPDFQRRCERLLAAAVAEGKARALHLAHLTDRIRFNERRPQLYGTIFDWDRQNQLSPWPIEDPGGLAERRRAVGLAPLSEATARARRVAEAEGDRPPGSFDVRQQEIEGWARRVGWLHGDEGAA